MHQNISYSNIWRIIIGSTIGNLVEWYDLLLYGYLASVISSLFFPSDNKLLSLTLTFTVFALSFFVRPLGGLLFGWIGDTYGRKPSLVISIFVMAIATGIIGFLPTYHSIGIASPILLCILRIFQGLSTGGEHTGSAIYVAEYAPPNRRTLWVTAVPASAALGIFFSSLASFLIITSFTPEQLLSWGWRTGYWIGTILCIISLYLRITLPETPKFQIIREHKNLTHRTSILSILKNKKFIKNLFLVFCLASSWGVFYQILFVWMPTYLTYIHHFSGSTALKLNSIFLIFFISMILFVGFCGDYISRRFLLILSCTAMLVFAYPFFKILSFGSLTLIYVAIGVFTIIFSLFIPTAFVCMIESFKIDVRYTGLSLAFNVGLAIFGGTTPLVVTWLIEITGNNIAPAFYMMLFSIIALLSSIYIRDKRMQPIF